MSIQSNKSIKSMKVVNPLVNRVVNPLVNRVVNNLDLLSIINKYVDISSLSKKLRYYLHYWNLTRSHSKIFYGLSNFKLHSNENLYIYDEYGKDYVDNFKEILLSKMHNPATQLSVQFNFLFEIDLQPLSRVHSIKFDLCWFTSLKDPPCTELHLVDCSIITSVNFEKLEKITLLNCKCIIDAHLLNNIEIKHHKPHIFTDQAMIFHRPGYYFDELHYFDKTLFIMHKQYDEPSFIMHKQYDEPVRIITSKKMKWLQIKDFTKCQCLSQNTVNDQLVESLNRIIDKI